MSSGRGPKSTQRRMLALSLSVKCPVKSQQKNQTYVSTVLLQLFPEMTRNSTIPGVRVVEKSHRFLMPRSLKLRTSLLSCVFIFCILQLPRSLKNQFPIMCPYLLYPAKKSKAKNQFPIMCPYLLYPAKKSKAKNQFPIMCPYTFCILPRSLKLRTSFLSCVLIPFVPCQEV